MVIKVHIPDIVFHKPDQLIEGRWELNQPVIEVHRLPKYEETLVQAPEIVFHNPAQSKLGLLLANQVVILDHNVPKLVVTEDVWVVIFSFMFAQLGVGR